MKTRLIVCPLIRNKEDKYLICKMPKDRGAFPGQWALPGGGIKPEENMFDALKREMKEELDIKVKVEKLACVINHILPNEKQHWVAAEFFAKIVEGEPRIVETDKHDELKWISFDDPPVEELSIATKLALRGIGK